MHRQILMKSVGRRRNFKSTKYKKSRNEVYLKFQTADPLILKRWNDRSKNNMYAPPDFKKSVGRGGTSNQQV
jgi:hypothetical protein